MSFIVKNTTFPGILDLLAPHSCRGCGLTGEPLCERCKNYIISEHLSICPNCHQNVQSFCLVRGASAGYDRGMRRAAPVTTGGRDVVPEDQQKSGFLRYKPIARNPDECPFCHFPLSYVVGTRSGLLETLIYDYKYNSTRALSKSLAALFDGVLPKLPKNTVIVPLPTATHHIRARGLDHTYKIAKDLGKLRNLPVEKPLLRNKNTVQVGATEKERLKQAAEVYILNPEVSLDPKKTYLLLDDVWTTGASMRAALTLMKKGGAKHFRIALLAVNKLN